MDMIFIIWAVARYEIKILLRSWFFRIFSILTLLLLLAINNGFFVIKPGIWMVRGIPSSIPYMNLLLLNMFQAVIGIFMASDFLKFDKKLDMTEVVYMRSMTNAEYVMGKTLGVFLVFMLLNIFVLGLALIIQFFFSDVAVVWETYLLYPLLISVPTLTFIFGLSFLVMVLVRSQAITFILLLGYIAGTVFFLGSKLHNVFDYMAFNLPLMYSDFIGISNLHTVLLQRGMYFLFGIGCIFGTVLAIRRLPQSKWMTRISLVLAVLTIAGGFMLGAAYLNGFAEGRRLREHMREVNARHTGTDHVSVTAIRLDIDHKGDTFAATASLSVINPGDEPVADYVFSLNPSLTVESVTIAGQDRPVTRDTHIITIEPLAPLAAGDADSLTITYSGTINEDACYIDIPEEDREEPYNVFLYDIDKRYAIVSPKTLLLTPEALWYPVPGIPYGASYPEIQPRDFMDCELTVHTRPGLTAISQGAVQSPEAGAFIFTPETLLPQMSLIVADYEIKAITVDDVSYEAYVLEGHDYFSEIFTDFGEQLEELIRESREDYERKIALSYPYERLVLVETPIQFYSYKRLWTQSQEVAQPEQILLPERGILIFEADFPRTEHFMTRGMRHHNETLTPAEMKRDILGRFIRSSLTSSDSFAKLMRGRMGGRNSSPIEQFFSTMLPENTPSYDIFPQYYIFASHFHSETWPIFNIAVENYLRAKMSTIPAMFARMVTGMSDEETANIELEEHTLPELLADPEKRDIISSVLESKSDQLFAMIKAKTENADYDAFMMDQIEKHRFTNIPVDTFVTALREEFAFDLAENFSNWYDARQLPAFVISDVSCAEVLDFFTESTRYQVMLTVQNPEPVDGVIEMEVIGGGDQSGGMRRFFRGGEETETEKFYYHIEGNQAKEIGLLLADTPGMIRINTYISQNLPSVITRQVPEPVIDDNAELFEGARIVDMSSKSTARLEIIVDNEDPGFEIISTVDEAALVKWVNQSRQEEEAYVGLQLWRPPTTWQAATQDAFYGEYKLSAHYKRAGSGDQSVQWTADITESGQYDVYVYTPDFNQMRIMGGRRRGGGRDGRNSGFGEQHFNVYHDDGVDDIIIDVSGNNEEWTYLGTYYLSEGSAKVELSDRTNGRAVFADAVKWVQSK